MIRAGGVRLGGRYELRSRLGVGGIGEVWLARDLSLRRTVAAKVLRPELAGDELFLDHLRTEARTTASLTHPNIAALYDYGEDDEGAGYLIMELVAGEPLSVVLARGGRMTAGALLPVLAQTASALHAAHLAGVVHRDVKPSNILLTRDGRVKVTDFGVSVGAGSAHPRRGTVMGTAHYLAPEQVLGHAAAPASDVYALGVVAFEAAVGRLPFTGPDLVAVANARLTEPLPPIPEDVHRPLAELVQHMLERDPRLRPRSAADLVHRLEEILDELGTTTAPAGTTPSSSDQDGAGAGEREPAECPVETAALPLGVAPADSADLPHHPGRGWTWLLVATSDVIALALRLAAYRLTASVTRARRGEGVPPDGPTTAARALTGDGVRAVGNASRRQTEVEDGSW